MFMCPDGLPDGGIQISARWAEAPRSGWRLSSRLRKQSSRELAGVSDQPMGTHAGATRVFRASGEASCFSLPILDVHGMFSHVTSQREAGKRGRHGSGDGTEAAGEKMADGFWPGGAAEAGFCPTQRGLGL